MGYFFLRRVLFTSATRASNCCGFLPCCADILKSSISIMTGDNTTEEKTSESSAEMESSKKEKQTKSTKRKHTDNDKTQSNSKKAKKQEAGKEAASTDASSSTTENASSTTTEDFISKIVKKRENICKSIGQFKFNKKRVRILTEVEDFAEDSDGVLYWMSREQRVQDNWAFLYAQRLALKLESPLHVCFCLVPKFLEGTARHFGFMMKGLAEVEKECRKLNIPFHLLQGEASKAIPKFIEDNNVGGIVTDFSPLRVPVKWVNDLKESLPDNIPLCQVDGHNLVPCWEASPKLEYGARTIRNKIHKQLGDYLTEFPPLIKHPHEAKKMPEVVDWKKADGWLEVDRTVKEVTWAKPGTEAGLRVLQSFCEKRLKHFSTSRNDPNKQALSNLSPWIHFGQISVQRCIIMVKQYQSRHSESVAAFVEEAIIRRELADNFCYYNEHYDSVKGAYDWAKKTLKDHKGDKRPYLYSRDELEHGKSHDDLWNAAQVQLVSEGKMHGFLRMYWAKKILEWTKSPEEALAIAIYLNDRYSLDGRDPNGYVGCMWSICGIHDQGWAERAVFGKIRYMNYQGCKRKFDVANFVQKYSKKSI